MSSRNRNQQSAPSGMSSRQKHNADMRRSKNAVGLTEFSQKKGQVRALEEFKKRKNRKHLDTSMALRKYRKLMKREGMEAGTGASRKRMADGQGDSDDDDDDDVNNEEEVGWNDEENDLGDSDDDEEEDDSKADRKRQSADQSDSDGTENGSEKVSDNSDNNDNKEEEDENPQEKKKKKKQTKPKKMDPFQKSRERAKLSKQRAEEAALGRATNEKERQQKLKRRKQQSILLQQRTKRGQPIMKHAINNLLYKLEKQKDAINNPTKTDKDHRRYQKKNRDQTQNDAPENNSQRKQKRSRKFY